MAKKIFGSLDLQTNSSLILRETDNTSAVSVKAPASLAADLTLTLPGTVTDNGVLSTSSAGVISSALLVDANISASAAISLSKLASLTADRVLVSSAGGEISASSVSTTTLGYLDATSSIQTQLNAKLEAGDITGKADADLANLTVSGLASQSLLVGSSSSAVAALAIGSEGQVLKVVGGNLAFAADAGSVTFKTDWETADTATFAIDHQLNTLDVMVQIYDISSGETIEVDTVERTDSDTVTVTASEAPPATGWRVLITSV
jgi:hypothetical protein